MPKMKNILFYSLCFIIIGAISCSKSDPNLPDSSANNSFSVTVDQYPEAISNHLASNYASLSIVTVELLSDGSYLVLMDNGVRVSFDDDGDFQNEDMGEVGDSGDTGGTEDGEESDTEEGEEGDTEEGEEGDTEEEEDDVDEGDGG